jgi:hypothetical protein
MNERRWEILHLGGNGMHGEEDECRWEIVCWLVESFAKIEMGDGRREVVHWSIEVTSKK